MKRLDISIINSHAPYVVKEDSQEGVYNFFADSGVEFSIVTKCIEVWVKY